MKKFIAILAMLVCLIPVFGQTTYWNVSDTTLQFYEAPNDKAKILLESDEIEAFEVYEVKDGWAKIKFGDRVAFLRENCIGSYEEFEKVEAVKCQKIVNESSWVLNLIGISTIVLLVCFVIRFYKQRSSEGLFYLNWGAFVLLSMFWIIYFFGYHIEYASFTEFLFKEHFGYLFLSLILAPIVQAVNFWDFNNKIKEHCKSKYGIMFGACSMLIGIVLFFILLANDVEKKWPLMVLGITECCQLVQSWIIFKSLKESKGLSFSLLAVFTYLIGVHSAAFAAIIILFLGFLALQAFLLIKIGIYLVRLQAKIFIGMAKRWVGLRDK